MSPYSDNYCDFQRFLLFRSKARNAGRSRKNAGNKPKCGISHSIAGRLTPMQLPLCALIYNIHAMPFIYKFELDGMFWWRSTLAQLFQCYTTNSSWLNMLNVSARNSGYFALENGSLFVEISSILQTKCITAKMFWILCQTIL